MEIESKESRIQLALDAYKKGQFKSLQSVSLAFDVPRTTLRRRIGGIASQAEKNANCQKLSNTEESTLSAWILDMAGRGLPLQLSTVHHLAQLLLSARLSSFQPVGECWVKRFIQRHPELKSKYTRKYDYQRAKCEDSQLIKDWFKRVEETIEKYGIVQEDIYNMDETGFQMGVTSTAKVVCGFETKQSHVKALQPGNREWVTSIVAINASGWALPAQIIFAAAKHQSIWYHELPEDYTISVSKNGWTTDQLGVEWLQKVFEPYTASRTTGGYRLLILDGHGSHATAGFDRFCMERKIIPLYMPPHSSHLLQPLDVSCFAPLKHLYGQRVQEEMQKGIHSVGKEDFIHIYPAVHKQALSSSNIQSGFEATGLVPLSSGRVLSKLQKTPTPPSTSHSNQSTQSFGIGKTPANLHQLEHQKKKIMSFKQHVVSPSIADKAIEKMIKGAEMTMQNAFLLQQQNHQLQSENQYRRKRKERAKHFIQDGGSLTVAEVRQQEEEQRRELERDEQYRPRRPPKCSNCGVVGHNRRQCSSR